MSNDIENCFQTNYIKDTICKIDKLQKEVISESVYRCVACEASLFTNANNTIPVVLSSCDGEITARTSTTTTTPYFRIESVRCNSYVTLRLLTPTTDASGAVTLTSTEFTTIVDMDCIRQIQCLEPITVDLCVESIPQAS